MTQDGPCDPLVQLLEARLDLGDMPNGKMLRLMLRKLSAESHEIQEHGDYLSAMALHSPLQDDSCNTESCQVTY